VVNIMYKTNHFEFVIVCNEYMINLNFKNHAIPCINNQSYEVNNNEKYDMHRIWKKKPWLEKNKIKLELWNLCKIVKHMVINSI